MKKILFLNIIFLFFCSIAFAGEFFYPGTKFLSAAIDPVETDLVWFGTDKGLLRYNKSLDTWELVKVIKKIKVIVMDKTDKNFIWIGSMEGVHRYDRGKKIWENISGKDGIVNTQVNTILIDEISKKYIWFITDFGFVRLNRESNEWKVYGPEQGLATGKINSICLDTIDTDSLWLGTEDGLFRYSRKDDSWSKIRPPDDFVPVKDIFSVAVDSAYILMGSATAGLIIYNREKNNWQLYTRKTNGESANDYILSINVDPFEPNYVWFGTKNHGVVRFDKLNNIWEYYGQENIRVSTLEIDKNSVWAPAVLCSGGGAFRFIKTENKWLYTEPLITIQDRFNLTWRKY